MKEYRKELSFNKALSKITDLSLNPTRVGDEFFTDYITLETFKKVMPYLTDKRLQKIMASIVIGLDPQQAKKLVDLDEYRYPVSLSIRHLQTFLEYKTRSSDPCGIIIRELPVDFYMDYLDLILKNENTPSLHSIFKNTLQRITDFSSDQKMKIASIFLQNMTNKKIMAGSSMLTYFSSEPEFMSNFVEYFEFTAKEYFFAELSFLDFMSGKLPSFWKKYSIEIMELHKYNIDFLERYKDTLDWSDFSKTTSLVNAKGIVSNFYDKLSIKDIKPYDLLKYPILKERFCNEIELNEQIIDGKVELLFIYPEKDVIRFINKEGHRLNELSFDLSISKLFDIRGIHSPEATAKILNCLVLNKSIENKLIKSSHLDIEVIELLEPTVVVELLSMTSIRNTYRNAKRGRIFQEKYNDDILSKQTRKYKDPFTSTMNHMVRILNSDNANNLLRDKSSKILGDDLAILIEAMLKEGEINGN